MGGAPSALKEQRRRFRAAGQGHVFAHWDKCTQAEKDELLAQLAELDVARLGRVFRATKADAEAGRSAAEVEPAVAAASVAAGGSAEMIATGVGCAAAGELAVLLLAGGQGTRLGSAAPKGCYDIGLPSGKSLFALQAERLAKLCALAGGASVPWYIMTSPFTDAETRAHFEEHGFFGLPPEDVVFFQQGWLPCVTEEGKIILEARGRMATAPDGNGGLYAALARHGVVDDMARRGVKYVHAYCVDNALVSPGDPELVGFCVQRGVEAGAKVIPKAYPEEPVGVYALRDGRPRVVEYSELPPDMATATDPATGELRFNAANIVLHFYTLPFLAKCCGPEVQDTLVYHLARKKIPCVSRDGMSTEKPAANNGVKLEAFIFDVYSYAETFALLEGRRGDDFAPVKNAEGSEKDSPNTARALVLARHRRWLEEAGATVWPHAAVEVPAELSLAGEGLEAAAAAGSPFKSSCIVTKAEEVPTAAAPAEAPPKKAAGCCPCLA